MKIEFEIADISRDEIVDALARQLLTDMVTEEGDEGVDTYARRSALAESLRKSTSAMIAKLSGDVVREHFDDTIKARIAGAVDDVLAAGWTRTDSYGNATGERLDLKGRISEIITDKKEERYGQPKLTLSEKLVKDQIEKTLNRELTSEIEAARKSLRSQLDAVVSGKVAETIKTALGLK